MDSNFAEESTSLTPKQKPFSHQHLPLHQQEPYQQQQQHRTQSPRLLLQSNRDRRMRLIRLGLTYYIAWFLMILFALLVPPYLLYFINEQECWDSRQSIIIISIVLSALTSIISFILLCIQFLTVNKTNQCRQNYCQLSFIILTLLFVLNFLLAIYVFNMFTCYFDPTKSDSIELSDSDWFNQLAIRYDLKIAAVLHLLCSVLAFYTAIGFAIIRNNFKYALRAAINN
ncbi:hypothetical protein NH340_JMT05319 [Sarcoptes scabiei]|nr:hypothetical protein NH340_JMT05319 [Sarcoptes scabiei]